MDERHSKSNDGAFAYGCWHASTVSLRPRFSPDLGECIGVLLAAALLWLPTFSTLQWGVTAFGSTSREIQSFLHMPGYDINIEKTYSQRCGAVRIQYASFPTKRLYSGERKSYYCQFLKRITSIPRKTWAEKIAGIPYLKYQCFVLWRK